MRPRLLIVVFLALAASGCISERKHELLAANPAAPPPAGVEAKHDIFVATTRKRAADQRVVFDRQRSDMLAFGRVGVTVPKGHQIGRIERAKDGNPGDPAKDFTAVDLTIYDSPSAFTTAVAKRGDRVLVFVHGYNTGFDDGVYRLTQIAHDTKYPGTPVLFSWASGARTRDYVYDKDSSTAARDDLESVLVMLSRTRGIKSIDIIAHSMGNWLAMETLRQLAIAGNRDLGGKLGYVVLASPDIDVDIFRKQMERYGKPDRPFVVLLSNDDKALRISSLIAGKEARVGDYSNAKELASLGVTVVDLSATAGGDKLNHAKFADNPVLVQLLGERLRMPESLEPTPQQANERVNELAGGLGQAASVIITTPLRIITLGAIQ
ncbi:alpha/beta hydrolase [Mesorhizobium sp. YM1C-6-2]|uniref:alpha/beta hydrolase n=1 Tax=Mesorhizobium sp. YM1C-6-2 TaxID=1827501 RepID=UPI000EF216A0|nr:alpha/beta hydrolase [Mesorhizobium sp. YM1C-6-2]RLP23363.1 alpha/beta hydrolase [Mesorhizobium sp. YM1C-6-2]